METKVYFTCIPPVSSTGGGWIRCGWGCDGWSGGASGCGRWIWVTYSIFDPFLGLVRAIRGRLWGGFNRTLTYTNFKIKLIPKPIRTVCLKLYTYPCQLGIVVLWVLFGPI